MSTMHFTIGLGLLIKSCFFSAMASSSDNYEMNTRYNNMYYNAGGYLLQDIDTDAWSASKEFTSATDNDG